MPAINTPLSADTYSGWLTPLGAWTYAARCTGVDAANGAVWALLRAGLLRAGARQHSWAAGSQEPATMAALVEIPRGHWRTFRNDGSDLWQGEYVKFAFYSLSGKHLGDMTYFGVRIDPETLKLGLPQPIYTDAQVFNTGKTVDGEHVAAAPPTAPQPEIEPTEAPQMIPSNKGGRPPKAFWEALWIEMAAQAWNGDIGPDDRQVKIEDAMADWLVANGEDASPATIRNAARKLLAALKAKKAKNLQ